MLSHARRPGENSLQQVIKSLNEILICVHDANWYCNFVIEITDYKLIVSWSQLLIFFFSQRWFVLVDFSDSILLHLLIRFFKRRPELNFGQIRVNSFLLLTFSHFIKKKVSDIIFMKIIKFAALEKPCFFLKDFNEFFCFHFIF